MRQFDVPQDVLAQADKCLCHHACLETGQCEERPLCTIESADGDNILFIVDGQNLTSCPYRLHFGESRICRCPVHFALYRKYKR